MDIFAQSSSEETHWPMSHAKRRFRIRCLPSTQPSSKMIADNLQRDALF